MRLATATEEVAQVVASQALRMEPREIMEAPPIAQSPVFAEFTPPMIERLGIPASFLGKVSAFTDPNDFELISALAELGDANKDAADLLLTFVTGDIASRQNVLKIARGEADYRPALSTLEIENAERNTDEFIGYDDPEELEAILDRGTFEQWQLFLHPDQKALVTRYFSGPARIRGLSGSGKTVVGLHRARYMARQLIGTGSRVLYTTFNKALAQSAAVLLDSLCEPEERGHIEVTHLHRWCLDLIEVCNMSRPRYDRALADSARQEALRSLSTDLRSALSRLPPEYICEEIEFIYGRFMHEESAAYLTTDRTGRGRAITETQREALLDLYRNYVEKLSAVGCVEFPEFVRIAYRLLAEGGVPESTYAFVIVDEVQDISEIGIKLLHKLVGSGPNGLLLIGDGTQRIYTRGYSLRDLGVEVGGRAVVLTKNYRNTQQILEAAFPLVEDQWTSEMASAQVELRNSQPQFSAR